MHAVSVPRHCRGVAASALIGFCLLAAPQPVRATADDLRLPDATYREAVALARAGDPVSALAALEREVTGPADAWPTDALLLRATLLEQLRLWSDAEPIWRAIAAREPALAEFAGRALVGNAGARPAPDEALLALTALEAQTGRAHMDLRADVGDVFARAGRDADAIAAYRRALDEGAVSALADRIRLALADALERTGDIPAALDVWRQARIRHRDGRTYATATDRERRLASRAGGAPTPLSSSQYAALTEALRARSRFSDAVALYEEWRLQPGADREAIDASVVDTLFDLRANEEGVARAEAFVRAYPNSPRVPHMHVVRFRLAVRMGHVEDARAQGLALWSGRIPGTSLAERQSVASLLAGFLVAIGKVDEGLEIYRGLYRTTRGSSSRMSVLWRAGVAAVRAGDLDRAAANFRGALALKPRSDTLPASKYWLAHIDDQRGRQPAARATWRELAQQYPYDYYGERSVARLAAAGQDAPVVPARAFPELSMGTATAHPAFVAATLLARAGLREAAADYAQRLMASRRREAAVALFAARAAVDAGDYRQALGLAVSYLGPFTEHPSTGAPPDLLGLAYPHAYGDDVERAARASGVDPHLLLALARKESLFDASARSNAGAIGLFQLMPETASRHAAAAGLSTVAEDDLLDPAASAAIAARLIRTLMDRYGGALPAVVAAYNAGHERVDLWWASGRTIPEDLFIDTIPYSETRRYVREVLNNYRMYRLIDEGSGR